MDKKQYNNIIDWTQQNQPETQTEDSLTAVRAVCNNMGVALPKGDLAQVAETLATDDYMYWHSCTPQEAQEAADNGIPTIGISEDSIVLLAATDEEQPVTTTATMMTLANSENNNVTNMVYYSYNCGTTNNQNSNSVCYQKVWNEIVFGNLDTLHQLAQQYDSTNQMKLVLQFVRKGVYQGDNWNIVAGEIDQVFVDFVEENNTYIYNFFDRDSLLIYDHSYSPVDFIHLCATMNGIIVGGGTYWKSLIVGKTHVRNLAGWAGDLQTLVVDAYVLTDASNDYDCFYNKMYQIMGSDDYSFSMKDLLADVDALNFANNWISSYWQSNLFGSACRYYYSNTDIPGTGWISRSNLRFYQFIQPDTKEQFLNTAGKYTKQNWILGVEWPIYESQAAERNISINLTKNQSDAAKHAFTDFVWE